MSKKKKENKVNIKDLFLNLQNEMQERLTGFRTYISHPVAKGDSTEVDWLEWMRRYLPRRYSVDRAFVIDYQGNLSHFIDIVIYDRHYSPFIFDQNGTKFIPAESVYAVFEIKQEINKENLEYAGEKVESVRKLERTSANIYDRGEKRDPRKIFNIIGGIIATDNGWKRSNPIKHIDRYNKRVNSNKKINIGCVLSEISFTSDEDELKLSNENEILIFFFLNLVKMLQQIGTVAPIEIDKYLNI